MATNPHLARIPLYHITDNPPVLAATRSVSSIASVECCLEYLDEGGANFIFKIYSGPGQSKNAPDLLKGKLLRLRKDLPHVQTTTEQMCSFREEFQVLFPQNNMIEHNPIRLTGETIALINEALKTSNLRAADRRRDLASPDERLALLVTDMRPADGTADKGLQLKLKWLVQSPNAPLGSKRCRTCAQRASRSARNKRTSTDRQMLCPLRLIHPDIAQRRMAAFDLTGVVPFVDFLVRDCQPLLQTLTRYQAELDPKGVLDCAAEKDVFWLCKAMTLRDCTLYLRLSNGQVEARLGDLDLKQPIKLPAWKINEEELIEGGWYLNTEHRDIWAEEKVCVLSK